MSLARALQHASALGLLCLSGCASVAAATLRHASARTVPCPEEQMVIFDDQVTAMKRTWKLTCYGRSYDCETTTKLASDASCTPMPGSPGKR